MCSGPSVLIDLASPPGIAFALVRVVVNVGCILRQAVAPSEALFAGLDGGWIVYLSDGLGDHVHA